MRVTRFIAVSAAIACGIVVPFLTGCGGSDGDTTPNPSPSPSASTTNGPTRAYAGTWESNCDFVRESESSFRGPITFVIREDGTFSATITANLYRMDQKPLKDTDRLGVFKDGDTRTINGRMTSAGAFTGTITVDNITNTLSGTMVIPQGSASTLRGTLVLTDSNVQLYNGRPDVNVNNPNPGTITYARAD